MTGILTFMVGEGRYYREAPCSFVSVSPDLAWLYYVLRAVGVSNWRTGVSWPFYEGAMCSDSRRQISKYAQQWDLADPWQMGLSGLGKTLASQ